MAPPRSVAVATCSRVPDLTADDQLLLDAIRRLGIESQPVVWDTPGADWGGYDGVVIRSCWDYHLRLPQFLAWISQVEEAGVGLWNPAPVLRWNADKAYLTELAANDVAVVPTCLVEQNHSGSLINVLEERGWDEVVVKPAVSASAHQTQRLNCSSAAVMEAWFRALCRSGRVLVQPFVREIQREGEWSLVFLGGEFSHAVLKHPADGDFRVQVELGGSQESRIPGDPLVENAERILQLVPGECLYARVDGCLVEGDFMLMELELLEPVLYLSQAPGSAQRLAAELQTRLFT